jgi:hypothetical protein
VLWTFRILLFTLPVLIGALTWKVCRDLQAGHHSERREEFTELPVASNDEDGSSLAPTPEPIGAQSEMRQPPR